MRKKIPWWGKIVIKILLSRLPVTYQFWKRLGLFEHGDMDHPVRAFETFVKHATTADLINHGSEPVRLKRKHENIVVLELGPGDSLFTALIAKSLGASRSFLVDAGSNATINSAPYSQMIQFLIQKGYNSFVQSISNLDEILSSSDCEFFTNGTNSLSEIPSMSVDFCFSNAVLEHVPKCEFEKLADELKRILTHTGIAVHRIDLKDHLGGGLNNLRFSNARWESTLFRNSGFYTNRFRMTEIIAFFKKAGFSCKILNRSCWQQMPLPNHSLASPFRNFSKEELLVREFDLVLRHET